MEDMVSNSKKRVRDSDESEHDSVEVKRLRDDLLDFLDDSDAVTATHDLDSFMKSFQDEISASNSRPTSPEIAAAAATPVIDLTSDSGESNPDLTHLLEASDDELGLPPSSGGFAGGESELVRVSFDSSGIGESWGFDENNGPSYDSFELNGGGSDFGDSRYVAFDGGLFEHSDVYFESADYSDFSWRFDSLPTE